MILYHIEKMHSKADMDTRTIYPRIPYNTMPAEDTAIPRICAAPSIRLCLQSTGFLTVHPDKSPVTFCAYAIDTESIPACAAIPPEELMEKKLVPDAMENQEFWIISPVEVKGQPFTVTDIRYRREIAWTCLATGDITDACENVGFHVPPGLQARHDSAEGLYRDIAKSPASQPFLESLKEELAVSPYAEINRIASLKIEWADGMPHRRHALPGHGGNHAHMEPMAWMP